MVEELDYGLEADAQRGVRRGVRRATRRSSCPRVVASAPKVIVTEWLDGHAAVEDHRRRHPRAARPRRATCSPSCTSPGRRGPGCCTPIRTPATSGCWPTAASASSTSAPSPGCPTGTPSRSAGCSRWALAGRADEVLADLRDEGFVRPEHRGRRRGGAGLPAADRSSRSSTGDFHFTRAWMQEQAARIADPRGRGQPARPPAQPAAGLPADPSGDARVDRRAVPARRRRAPYRGRRSSEWLPGFVEPSPDCQALSPAPGWRATRPQDRVLLDTASARVQARTGAGRSYG